jgi:hypothetical protein
MQNDDKQIELAPYESPKLRIYGDVAALTETIQNSMGNSDTTSGRKTA